MERLIIIPGGGENTEMRQYQSLAAQASSLGYNVKLINPDWNKPLHKQIFRLGKNDIAFGFSRGALLAYISTKKYPAKLAILASMTPIRMFSKKVLTEYYGEKLANDLLKIKFVGSKTKKIRLAGEKEKKHIKADVYIPQTDHYLNKRYLQYVIKILRKSKK